ncbi:MAG: HYC_CC_PP family protein [Flavisolibacter sp.]
MKKIVAIIFLLVYGLSSTGATLQFHYCCGKLKSVKLTPVTEKQCGMKHSTPVKKKCCDDKQIELKIKADQKTQQAAKFNIWSPSIAKKELAIVVQQPVVSTAIVPEVFAPPPLGDPLYILHCVYRI